MKDFDKKEYCKEVKVISIEKASNAGLLLMLPVFAVFIGLFFLFHGNPLPRYFNPGFSAVKVAVDIALAFAVFIGGIVLHELIHGATWAIFARRGFRSIRFGVLWKYATPYCHCKEPLKIKHYLAGAITPAIFLGFMPAIYGVVVGWFSVMFFGMIFIVAAIGDFMIFRLLMHEDGNDYAQDHPSEAGCYVFRKIK